MNPDKILQLDPVIHAPARLAILSILVSVDNADFKFLKESTGATDGNLSTHLSKLEASGYITIEKSFQGKKPQTRCALTPTGREAFLRYFRALEQIVRNQKKVNSGE